MKLNRTHRVATQNCPYCGAEQDAVTGVDNKTDGGPKTGDATMCIDCGESLIFNHDMTLRKPNEKEQAELESDIRYHLMKLAIKTIQAGKTKH